jgi:hypothetical protein
MAAARTTVRKAKASMAKVTCRCQAVQMRGGRSATPGDHPARNAMDDFAELDALN